MLIVYATPSSWERQPYTRENLLQILPNIHNGERYRVVLVKEDRRHNVIGEDNIITEL